jgi:molybdopterin molybdotransferase
MLTYQQALARCLGAIRPLATEPLPLIDAVGRTLAADVIAPFPMPPFDQSLMDGYAVRSADTRAATAEQPVRLLLGATVTAGTTLEQPLAPREVVRIMTGAPLPAGADAVIKLEDGELEGRELVMRHALARGTHVQRRGAEIRQHTTVIRRGSRLTPQRLGLAAALGLRGVEVTRQPCVALIAPGDELLPPGVPLQPGKKWCSNLYALDMRTREIGAISQNLGIVPDTPVALTTALQQGLSADVVVILGASGRGDHDFARQALAHVEATVLFQGVAMSPGRSMTVAQCQGTLVFNLPGSPWAAFLGYEVFVRPTLVAMLGQRPLPPVAATLTVPLEVRAGVTHLLPVRLRQHVRGWQATPLRDLFALAQAESDPIGLLVVPPHRRRFASGAPVRIHHLTVFS